MSKQTLVIGSTGKVGRHAVSELSERGESVRPATRRPGEIEYDWAERAAPIHFDYDQPETIPPAVDGVDRIFSIVPPADPRAPETIQPVLDAAERHDIEHLVFMSAYGVDQAPDDMPLRAAELAVRDAEVDTTLLRPNWFMQNFYPGWIHDVIQQTGDVRLPAGDGATSFIDSRDIARTAATVITESGYRGESYTLTGPEALDHHEVAALLSDASGRAIEYVPTSDEALEESLSAQGWGPKEIEFMVGLFQGMRQGQNAAVTDAVEEVTGRPPRPFESYADDFAEAWT